MEATKNNCAKGKDVVNQNTITRWFKKFHLACKDQNDQARSGRPKTGFQACEVIEANPVSSTREYEVSLASHNPVWFVTITTSAKASRAAKLCY